MKKLAVPALAAMVLFCACTDEKKGGSDGGSDAGSCTPVCDQSNEQILWKCEGGVAVRYDCMAAQAMLCQDAKCIEPARFGNPKWGTCPDVKGGTPETLASKAAFYDTIASKIHLNANSNITQHITLKDGRSIQTATGQDDVQSWHTDENDGLWSGHYLASQAYRYAATGSPEALENVKSLLKGHRALQEVTGKPGIFARQFVPAATRGMTCPSNPEEYTHNFTQKSGNRWQQVAEDGCIKIYDSGAGTWKKLDNCAGGSTDPSQCWCIDRKYAGYCWQDNVSIDSLIGSIYSMGIVYRLIDDPAVRADCADLVGKSIKTMIDNGMKFIDWDGLLTSFGSVYPLSGQEFPGFSAIMALSYVKTGAIVTGDKFFANFYRSCLLREKTAPKADCSKVVEVDSYLNFITPELVGLYKTVDGCKNNYNNFNMTFMGLHTLLWFETDVKTREYIQNQLETDIMGNGSKRDMWFQKDSYFNFIYAATKKLGKDSSGPAYQMVEDAVCSLRQFPTTKTYPLGLDNEKNYPFDCIGRLGGKNTTDPIPLNDRFLWIFTWSSDVYQMQTIAPTTQFMFIPADYLLPYWMGRYYGFISGDM
ncbi:MAG: hypothetical protein WC889_05970 [Myxococcota bacterium]